MVAVTVQGVPEDVQPPVVTAVSPSSLHVNWSEPTFQNGKIQRYHLNQTGVGTIFTHIDGPRNFTVTGRTWRILLLTFPCLFILSSCLFFSCYSLNCTFLFLQLCPPLSRFLSLLLCRVLFCVPVCRSCVMTEFTPDCCHMLSVLMAYTNRNILACMRIKERKIHDT